MDTEPIIEVLSNIKIGTVISWIIVIGSLIAFISTAAIKIYKLIIKTHESIEENESFKEMVKKHDGQLQEITNVLTSIRNSLDEQRNVNLKNIRHVIVHVCEEAITSGEISACKLKSLEEMFDEYTNVFHGNGYVKTLVIKVRELPVIGITEEE